MNPRSFIDCVIITGCAMLGLVPFFDTKRVRVRWAKLAFGMIAVIGMARGGVRLAWDLGCFILGQDAAYRLDSYLYIISGVLLGLFLSLILSGQLTGAKRGRMSTSLRDS